MIRTKEEARELANDILHAFGKNRNVVINWTGKAKNGRAHWFYRRITIGPRVWRGVEMCLLHEVAHLVAPRNALHSYQFFVTLAAIAKHHFGDVRLYDWHNEYRRLRLWAWKEGWCIRYASGNYYPHPIRYVRLPSAAGPRQGG